MATLYLHFLRALTPFLSATTSFSLDLLARFQVEEKPPPRGVPSTESKKKNKK